MRSTQAQKNANIAYRKRHSERIRERQREKYWKDPAKAIAKTRLWQSKNKARVRDRHLQRTFSITLQEYDVLLSKQGFCCAVCLREAWEELNGTLHVDHDHGTGRVRGLLCRRCNSGLGQFQDDVSRLGRAIVYLAEEES